MRHLPKGRLAAGQPGYACRELQLAAGDSRRFMGVVVRFNEAMGDPVVLLALVVVFVLAVAILIVNIGGGGDG